MLSTVLVPLDGSRFAEAALPLAIRLASAAEARLYLVSVNQPVAVPAGMGELAGLASNADEEAHRQSTQYLAGIAARCGLVGNRPVEFRLVDGLVGEAICDEAGRIGADLIVMATHGRGALGRLVLGSIADHVIRRSTRPVMVVHPSHHERQSCALSGGSILVAIDESEYSDAILDPVVDLALCTASPITLVTVVAPSFDVAEPTLPHPVPQHPAIVARRSDQAHGRLRAVAERLQSRGLQVTTRVVVGDSAAGGILTVLGESRFDIVALTTHGAAGVRRLLLGSVAEKVIRAASKPVLALHPAFSAVPA
jgi:nucleotide-binding universal stress UspA family protein